MSNCDVKFDLLKSSYQWWPFAAVVACGLLSSLVSYSTGYRRKLLVIFTPLTLTVICVALLAVGTLLPYLMARDEYAKLIFYSANSQAIERM